MNAVVTMRIEELQRENDSLVAEVAAVAAAAAIARRRDDDEIQVNSESKVELMESGVEAERVAAIAASSSPSTRGKPKDFFSSMVSELNYAMGSVVDFIDAGITIVSDVPMVQALNRTTNAMSNDASNHVAFHIRHAGEVYDVVAKVIGMKKSERTMKIN